MHSQQPLGVVQNWSTLQCSKQNTEQCGYDHAPVTRGRMRAQFPLPHGPTPPAELCGQWPPMFLPPPPTMGGVGLCLPVWRYLSLVRAEILATTAFGPW